MADQPDDKRHSRRDMFKLAGAASALAGGVAEAQEAAPKPPPRREALENLTAAEADILEAFCARLVPSDANGPGATEARAAHYIDRALGSALAASRERYRSGLMALDATARATHGAAFASLPAAAQDALLTELETKDGAFFALVRQHTLQGMFCDPYYGGNANYTGWDLLSYPGLRLAVSERDQAMEPHLTPVRKSAYDFAMFDRSGVAHAGLADPTPMPGMDMSHDH